MKRPLAVIGIGFLLSLLAASFLTVNMNLVMVALLAAAFILVLCLRPLRRAAVLASLLAAAVAFAAYALYDLTVWRPLQVWHDQEASLTLETLDFVDGGHVTARVVDGDLPRGTRVTLWFTGRELQPEPYDRVEGRFLVSAADDQAAGLPNGTSKAGRAAVYVRSSAYYDDGLVQTAPEKRPWFYQILRLRRHVRMTVLSHPRLDGVGGLLSGLAFGFKGDVPGDIRADFTTVGVPHLLAVSGLHTSLLAHALLALLLFVRVPRRAAGPLASAGVLVFMALTGFTPSVMRAGVMCIVVLLGMTLGREADSLNSLGLAGLAVTLFDPSAIHDVGLLLSFAATWGLLVLWPRMKAVTADKLKEKGGRVAWLAIPAEMAGITIAATIPTLPVTFYVFGRVSLIAPVGNILMVYPALAAMLLTYAGVCICSVPFLQGLGAFVFNLAKWAADYLIAAARALAAIPYAAVPVDKPWLLLWLPGIMLLVWLGWRLRGRRGVRAMALWSVIALLSGMLSSGFFGRGVTDITVDYIGGEVTVLLRRGNRSGLIVTGAAMTKETLYYRLRDAGVARLDFLMLPDQQEDDLRVPASLAEQVAVDSVITGSRTADAASAPQPWPPADQRLYWDEGEIGFWNGKVNRLEGGWLRLCIGDTRLLICPAGGNAGDLPAAMRETHLVVFAGAPPRQPTAITALAGVQGCGLWELPWVAKGLPQGTYPIRNTARGAVTLQTRGQGDIQFKWSL